MIAETFSGSVPLYSSLNTDATILLEHVDHGNIQVVKTMGTFEDSMHYYRQVPRRDIQINPNLEQIFGWE